MIVSRTTVQAASAFAPGHVGDDRRGGRGLRQRRDVVLIVVASHLLGARVVDPALRRHGFPAIEDLVPWRKAFAALDQLVAFAVPRAPCGSRPSSHDQAARRRPLSARCSASIVSASAVQPSASPAHAFVTRREGVVRRRRGDAAAAGRVSPARPHLATGRPPLFRQEAPPLRRPGGVGLRRHSAVPVMLTLTERYPRARELGPAIDGMSKRYSPLRKPTS
jgi:hypothetical protein